MNTICFPFRNDGFSLPQPGPPGPARPPFSLISNEIFFYFVPFLLPGPFMGNCIGYANHRFFLLYLWLESFICIWAFFISIEVFGTRGEELKWPAWAGHGAAAGVLFIISWLSLMLALFHSWLALSNQTTYQIVQIQRSETPLSARRRQRSASDSDSEQEQEIPPGAITHWTYNAGLFWNLFAFCCARPPLHHRIPPGHGDEEANRP